MREYRLYTTNWMRDLNFKSNDSDEMKKRVEEIKELVKENKESELFFEGSYIDIIEDGEIIKSVDYDKFEGSE